MDHGQQPSRAVPLCSSTASADPGSEHLRAGVSVIVPSHQGALRLTDCLRSLAAQTLDPDLFEVVVVLNGEPDGSRSVVDRFREGHRDLTVRVLELASPGVSLALNTGLAAATRRYATVVDDDDTVSPGYLETLLSVAAAGRIPLGQVVDVHDGGRIEAANPVNNQIVRYAGRTVHPDRVPRALGLNAGKLVPTAWARAVGYDTALASGSDVVFFMALLARYDFRVAVCPIDGAPGAPNAVYYRRVRP